MPDPRPFSILALALVPSALGAPPPAPAAEPSAVTATALAPDAAIEETIGRARRAAGLDPLARHPALDGIASARAAELAAAGTVDSDAATISRLTRRLYAGGYRPHRWVERSIIGAGRPLSDAPALVDRWSEEAGTAFVDSVLGAYSDLGVGAADGPAGTVVVVLFAFPRRAEAERRAALLADLEVVRAAVLADTNAARERAGRSPVTADPLLDQAAQRHAEDMLARGYYDHQSPSGSSARDRLQAVGYGPLAALSENIAKGLFSPEEVVERWLGSSGHRRNLLDRRVTETGLGVAAGVDQDDEVEVLWVQLFARPR